MGEKKSTLKLKVYPFTRMDESNLEALVRYVKELLPLVPRLTTHSTGAEIARMSFARLKAARHYFPPG